MGPTLVRINDSGSLQRLACNFIELALPKPPALDKSRCNNHNSHKTPAQKRNPMKIKEYAFGNVEKAPPGVKKADQLLKILTGDLVQAKVRSSHRKDPDFPNLNRMLKIDQRDIRFGVVDKPKNAPEVIFVGAQSDLQDMKVAFTPEGQGAAMWSLAIKSKESVNGTRTVIIANGQVSGDHIEGMETSPAIDMYSSDGERFIDTPVAAPASLIVVFVDSRLHQDVRQVGSMNVF